MKNKIYFENKNFKVFLISYLLLFIIYNGYIFIVDFPIGWVPVIINIAILILVIVRYHHLKNVLKIWSGIFLIFFPLLQVISKLFKFFLGGENFYEVDFLMALFFVIVGTIIFIMTKTIKNTFNNLSS